MKIVEFTINIGGYDKPRTDITNINDCDIFRNNARNASCIKTLVHKYVDADVSIFYDGNIVRRPEISKEEIVDRYLADADMCVTVRRKGNYGIYDEIEASRGRVVDPGELLRLDEQKSHYKAIGIPENTPVYGYQPTIRRHSPLMEAFNEAWWAEMCRWNYRCQIAFPVVLMKFPELKIRNVELGEIRTKLYRHSHHTFPIVLK